jgi:hypothetical protein
MAAQQWAAFLPLVALSGLFELARLTLVFGGKADICFEGFSGLVYARRLEARTNREKIFTPA